MPPGEAREFCDWLQSAAAPQLGSTHFSVCALGDRCGGGRGVQRGGVLSWCEVGWNRVSCRHPLLHCAPADARCAAPIPKCSSHAGAVNDVSRPAKPPSPQYQPPVPTPWSGPLMQVLPALLPLRPAAGLAVGGPGRRSALPPGRHQPRGLESHRWLDRGRAGGAARAAAAHR